MSYTILGVCPGHNGSVCLIKNGKVLYFNEEERLSRVKYDANPFLSIIEALKISEIDELVIVGTSFKNHELTWTREDAYESIVKKIQNKKPFKLSRFGNFHHLAHASLGFYNSGFEEASVLVVDGSGSLLELELPNSVSIYGHEAETIFSASYPNNFQTLYFNIGHNDTKGPVFESDRFSVNYSVNIVKAYEAITNYLGFAELDAGKVMGLAPYGSNDSRLDFFHRGRGRKDFFIPNYPQGAKLDIISNEFLRFHANKEDNFHNNPEKLLDIQKNVAFEIQRQTQEQVGNLIEKSLNINNSKNIVVVGGYGLNCVANAYYKRRFPEINLYVEPISSDAGTSFGAALNRWYAYSEMNLIRKKQTTLFYGSSPVYNLDIVDNQKFDITEVTYSDIAKLISDRNIVCLFQGKSEAGPRALGNRSIIYDPTDTQGKEVVNKIKKREWFRPFAATILKEKCHEWFDMLGMDESPFMSYALHVKEDKKNLVPSVIHVDGTCRIQTVTLDQNKHFYNLIIEFDKLKDVPLLFNTSFNLAGDPLVETFSDALETLEKSDLKYLYCPDLGKLFTKK